MAKDKVLLRKTDGSGSGYLFNREDARRFLKENPRGFVEESPDETEANQRAADEEVKALEASEDKSVKMSANKARG